MSISKQRTQVGTVLWAHCDICDDEECAALGPCHNFTELKDLMISEGWHISHEGENVWRHFCPHCWEDVNGGEYGF